MNITVLGGGSWGSALAIHLAKNGHSIKVWEFFAEQAQQMQETRICPLLPDAKFPDNVFISSEMEQALTNAELVLLVVPSDKVEVTVEKAKHLIGSTPVVICSKGFGSDLQLLSDVVKRNVSGEVYCLYGPTHAEEVHRGVFSGIVLAGVGEKEKIKAVIEGEELRVDLTDDLIGVQVASALKNILAVFIGVLVGAGYGDNTKAYVLTRGVEEIKQIGVAWGAKPETFYGLAGLGDIIVTTGSKHSRNRHVGEQVGKGKKLDDVIAEMKMVAEGVTTLQSAVTIKDKLNVDIPVIVGLHQILFEGKDVEEVVRTL